MPTWMAAADLVVLPSWNEGTPNVVVESLACGRRVVATAVGGTPDLVTSSTLGTLVPPRNPAALAAALNEALATPYDPHAVAAAAPASSWDDSAAQLHTVLEEALREF
jgi:teichuronic acid biosynthesis glycosyltransferase TuaC